VGRGYVAITILDINDNAPEFAMDYETTVCENAQPGQVRCFASATFLQFL
jgi:cadherin 15 (M-cadherin)